MISHPSEFKRLDLFTLKDGQSGMIYETPYRHLSGFWLATGLWFDFHVGMPDDSIHPSIETVTRDGKVIYRSSILPGTAGSGVGR